jgi:hypothetical protein
MFQFRGGLIEEKTLCTPESSRELALILNGKIHRNLFNGERKTMGPPEWERNFM